MAQAIYQEQEAQAVQLRILCLESEPSANAEDAQPKPVLLAGKGVTLEEAWQAAQQQAGGQVFLGQCRVWMLGLGQAKQLNPEDAEFWMQQDPGCGSMDLWLVDVSPQALDEPEQPTALANAVENVQEDSPAYLAAGQELLLLPQVKLAPPRRRRRRRCCTGPGGRCCAGPVRNVPWPCGCRERPKR